GTRGTLRRPGGRDPGREVPGRVIQPAGEVADAGFRWETENSLPEKGRGRMAIRKVCSAVLLAWAVLLVNGTALGAPEAQTSQLFTELPPRHWSYNAVRSLSTAGLVREPPDGFGAGLTVTRLEMALEVGEAMDRLR